MDELSAHIQDEAPWCMLFVDDIMLLDESRDDMNMKPKRWRKALESKGFKIIRTKTKYMNYNFNGDVQNAKTPKRFEAQEIP